MRRVVISDVHLGPGGPLTIFREADALVELLRWVADSPPTELVLAGDVFDFLQCDEYRGFDPALAPNRFHEIASNPDTAAVLVAVGAIAQDPRHHVVVLSGNHDPELVLPAVRGALESTLGASVSWADDRILRAPNAQEAGIWGHSVPFGEGAAWIVHGDRWDPNNFVDRHALLLAAERGIPARLPAGSHLVCDVLSKVTPDHPWVHELKPEFPAVLLLLLYIEPQRTCSYLRQHHRIEKDLLLGVARAKARRGPLFDSAEPPSPDTTDLAKWLGARIGAELDGPEQVAELKNWLDWGAAHGALAGHDGIGKFFLRAWLRAIRALDRFGELDGPDRIPGDATRFLPADVSLLVAGHTHGRRISGRERVRYLNTGTWLPVANLPAGDLTDWIDRLERGERWPSVSPRTFAVVEPQGTAGLWTWTDKHRPEALGHV